MIRLVSAATLAAFALLALALPATAQIMPTLKRDVVVTGDLVTIGDLIDHAGASASIAVFRAPDLGETGTVPASRVLEAVHRYNMPSIDIGNIADVTVTHDARVVTVADIRALIRREVNAKLSVQAETLSLTFDTAPHDVQIEATATAAPRIEQISFDPRSGRFDASIEVPGSAIARRLALRFTGSAVETVEVPVLTRTLARGDVIQDGDVALERRPKSETTGDVLGTSERAIGFSSRQGLARGRVLRRSDLTKPEIVKRNETVTIVFETPGILLTVRGTALDSGGVGDLINVTNVQSKRTVQAIVVGPGRVRPASMPAPTTVASAAARSQQARVIRMSKSASESPSNSTPVSKPTPQFKLKLKPGIKMSFAPQTTRNVVLLGLLTSVSLASGGCSAIDRLTAIGEQPSLSPINNPVSQPGYKPVQMPMPQPQPASYNPNSLWRNGSRAFFKDQRAHQIGDILTVTVNLNDKAAIANETQRSRSNTEDSGVTDFLGKNQVPASIGLPGRILSADSKASSDGKGSVNRQEAVQTNVAAVVTQVLPNGNLVVEGKQEIRVNFEKRQLIVAGIVRPEDIQSDNTIDSSKIAEARIAYGGTGQITDVQQPRYGQQVLDVLLPF